MHNNFPKYNPTELEPGVEFFVEKPTVGWARRFRHSRYIKHTVTRITPKRTKVYATNGKQDVELATNQTTFYKDSPELQESNRLAQYTEGCLNLLYRVNKHGNEGVMKATDEEIVVLYGLLKQAMKILDKPTA